LLKAQYSPFVLKVPLNPTNELETQTPIL